MDKPSETVATYSEPIEITDEMIDLARKAQWEAKDRCVRCKRTTEEHRNGSMFCPPAFQPAAGNFVTFDYPNDIPKMRAALEAAFHAAGFKVKGLTDCVGPGLCKGCPGCRGALA